MHHPGLICFLLLKMVLPGLFPAPVQEAGNKFNKSSFYAAMRGKEEAAVDKQIALLAITAIEEKTAYEGALLMKKAGLASGPKKKLDLFKEGHEKLEAVLNKDSSNTEYRFLRLMIQEHAPGILGYKKQIESDKRFVKNNYKKLSPVVQEAVVNYSKESKILKPADL